MYILNYAMIETSDLLGPNMPKVGARMLLRIAKCYRNLADKVTKE
jgi:hypothetical protein